MKTRYRKRYGPRAPFFSSPPRLRVRRGPASSPPVWRPERFDKANTDGADIRDISQKRLRDLVGRVPQKGILFSGTIESNLKYAGETVTGSTMKEAAYRPL